MTNEATPTSKRPSAKKKKPTAGAQASRWVAAGAATGASLAMVGTMARAAGTAAEPVAVPVIRRVVVPQTATPTPVDIVIPERVKAMTAPSTTQAPAMTEPLPVPTTAPVQAPAKQPMTESSGS